MTSLSGPVLSLIELKGYRYSQICHTNIAYCFNRVGIPRTVPSQFFCYLPKKVPQIRVEDLQPTQTRTQKINQSSQSKQESKGDLNPKVTPLLKESPAESPVLWYDGRTDLGFTFFFRKCFGWARVSIDFLFYPKERLKSTAKTFEMFSWVRGVDYRKGRY